MMNLSEESIRDKCPHCDPGSFALKYVLKTTDNFRVVCDAHPLIQGHILIIPKKHLSCIGEYPQDIFQELTTLYQQVKIFIQSVYGSVSTFEHGVIGQTVFHSHIQIFPYAGPANSIIPEGGTYLKKISGISDLSAIFKQDRKYLYFSVGINNWAVDTSIGGPGFFRDRFGTALGNEIRANWKNIHDNKEIMDQCRVEIDHLMLSWNKYNLNRIECPGIVPG